MKSTKCGTARANESGLEREREIFMYNQIENISQPIFKHAKLNIIIDYAAATLVYIHYNVKSGIHNDDGYKILNDGSIIISVCSK